MLPGWVVYTSDQWMHTFLIYTGGQNTLKSDT